METMVAKKVPATLKYANPGAQPPVFLAGSFSEPAWEPLEMEYTTSGDGEHQFTKEVLVEQGKQFQYKFRIGTGDWWALNEEAPIVTDDLGNRNNLLAFPSAIDDTKLPASIDSEHEDSAAKNTADICGGRQAHAQQKLPVDELIIEKVDIETQHEDDIDSQGTTGQEDAHEMSDKNAKLDMTMVSSGTITPKYAADAAEVADTAATLDHEASPPPLSDEEAGRLGLRRLSATPIPEVALTAAEVADSAAVLDQDECQDEMRTSLPPLDLDTETPSGRTTPSDERVPLFSHECLHSPDYEVHESPPRVRQREDSLPSSQITEETIVDFDDPTLEKFPTDYVGVLEQIRSIESRLSADEVRDDDYHSPVVVSPKNGSPTLRTPSSTRPGSKTSPLLEAISEEAYSDEGPFAKLPSPVSNKEDKLSPQLDVISEEAPEPETSPVKLSCSTASLEQVYITEAVPALIVNSGDEQQQGLIERQESAHMKELMEDGKPTTSERQRNIDNSMTGTPLLSHEEMVDGEEPADTTELAESEELIHGKQPTLIEGHPKVLESAMTKPILQHEDLTEAEVSLNGEGSESPPRGAETKAMNQDLPRVTKPEDKKSGAEASSIAETDNESKVGKPKSDVLEKSNDILELETGVSKENRLQEEPNKGIDQHRDFMAAKEVMPNFKDQKIQDEDKLASHNPAELPKTNESQSESSNISVAEALGTSPLEQASEINDETPILFVTLEDETRPVEEAIASTDDASRDISMMLRIDSLATTVSSASQTAREPTSAEDLTDILASVNEIDQKTHTVVETEPFPTPKEVPTNATNEDATKVAVEGIPENAIDEDSMVAVEGEHASVKVADQAGSATAVKDDLHAIRANLGNSKLSIDEDILTTTSDKDGPKIIADGEISAMILDNESPPFLVDAGRGGFEPEDIIYLHANVIDTAKSTSFEEPLTSDKKDSDIKTRISSTIERPVTPASIHSALSPKESSNFFKALWRTVFVGWIGGLIHRIFGGRRSSLFTVCALLLFGGWYFSAAA